jgi:UvrD-like helicase C-terminal domain
MMLATALRRPTVHDGRSEPVWPSRRHGYQQRILGRRHVASEMMSRTVTRAVYFWRACNRRSAWTLARCRSRQGRPNRAFCASTSRRAEDRWLHSGVRQTCAGDRSRPRGAHAYAVTIHRSQGSEYPAVVIALATSSWRMLRRNLLCTRSRGPRSWPSSSGRAARWPQLCTPGAWAVATPGLPARCTSRRRPSKPYRPSRIKLAG